MNQKKCCILILAAILFALIAYVAAQNAQDTADINNIFIPYPNLTNLAPTFEIDMPGTGERVDNNTYWANDTSIELHVYAHANTTSQTAEVLTYINDTLICPRSGRPLGGAETAYRGCDLTIPKGTYYRVDFFNYHHYEWYEFPILSGKNGTLSVNNFYNSSFNGYINTSIHFLSTGLGIYGVDNLSSIILYDSAQPEIDIGTTKPDSSAFATITNTCFVSDDCEINLDTRNDTLDTEIQSVFNPNSGNTIYFTPSGNIYILNDTTISHTAYSGIDYSNLCLDSNGVFIRNSSICSNTPEMNVKVNKSGDNMTGTLNIDSPASFPQLNVSSNSQFTRINVDTYYPSGNANIGFGFFNHSVQKFSLAVYQANSGNLDYSVYNAQKSHPSYLIDGDTDEVTYTNLSGTGNAAVCVNSAGKLYRSTNSTSNYLTC